MGGFWFQVRHYGNPNEAFEAVYGTLPAHQVSAVQKPEPSKPRVGLAMCMAGELVNNFFGDRSLAGITVGVHVAAKIAGTAAGSFLPGPGWLYTTTAILWDLRGVGKSYVVCKQD